MNIFSANAIFLALLATWIIPLAIRDKETGRYIGYANRKTLVYFILVIVTESLILSELYGLEIQTILKICINSALPFVAAYFFVKYSQKRLYGNEFNSENNENSQGDDT